jgi:hypothetical protein
MKSSKIKFNSDEKLGVKKFLSFSCAEKNDDGGMKKM